MITEITLQPGVTLRCFTDNRFKQGCLSLQLLRPMRREEAGANALIPTVLLRGCESAPDLRQITGRLDDLYGASVGPLVRQMGDYQGIGFYASFISDRYALQGDKILAPMVAAREIHREYLAIVNGRISPESGTIDAPICRTEDSIIERHVDFEKGERAVTHYQLSEYKNGYSLLSIHLETGRTHQIRVHMKYIGFPLIGDSLYNPLYARDTAVLPQDPQEGLPSCKIPRDITRQALHSHRLQFTHPITGEKMDFIAPLPPDMARVLTEA